MLEFDYISTSFPAKHVLPISDSDLNGLLIARNIRSPKDGLLKKIELDITWYPNKKMSVTPQTVTHTQAMAQTMTPMLRTHSLSHTPPHSLTLPLPLPLPESVSVSVTPSVASGGNSVGLSTPEELDSTPTTGREYSQPSSPRTQSEKESLMFSTLLEVEGDAHPSPGVWLTLWAHNTFSKLKACTYMLNVFKCAYV